MVHGSLYHEKGLEQRLNIYATQSGVYHRNMYIVDIVHVYVTF